MNRIIAFIVLLMAAVGAHATTIPITLFSSAVGVSCGSAYSAPTAIMNTTATSATPKTFTSSVGTGNLLVFNIVHQTAGSQSVSAFVDSAGNTYTKAVALAGSGGSQFGSEIWYTKVTSAITSGATTFTITASDSIVNVQVAYTSGGLGIVDTTASTGTGLVTTFSLSSGTLSCANEILFGNIGPLVSGASISPGTGFTTIYGTANEYSAYSIVSSTASVTWSPTTTAQVMVATLASFK